jgi:hypothetical protein
LTAFVRRSAAVAQAVVADNDPQRISRNWKTPGTYDTAVVGAVAPNASRRGWTGFGAANYLTTGGYKSWFTAANLADQNDHSIFAWRSDNASNDHYLLGTSRLGIGARQFGATPRHRNGNTANAITGACTRSDGLWVNTRRNAADYEVWGNATASAPSGASPSLLVTTTLASGASQDSQLVIGMMNIGVGTITAQSAMPSGAIIPAAGAGGGLTAPDIAALNTAIYTYLNTLGRL